MTAFALRLRRVTFGGVLGLSIVLFWVTMTAFGAAVAPHDAGDIVDMEVFLPVSAQFPFGTDYLGRGMLSRVLHGTRYTVGLALAAALIASGSGLLLGMCAAVWGGLVDGALSRTLDTLISIPSKMFALVVVAAFGSSVPVLVLMAGVIYTPGAYRIARSLAVTVNAQDFVTVARARGEGTLYLAVAEILPN